VIYEEDKFGNVETGDNTSVVRVALNSGNGRLQGKTTAVVTKGVAAFTNLGDTKAETITLKFSGGSLNAVITNPIKVAPPVSLQPPTILGETPVLTPKVNRKGKVLSGFLLQYSAPMNLASANRASNYQVVSLATKRVKGKNVSVSTRVNVAAKYDPTTRTVKLTFSAGANPLFTRGGQIMILALSPSTGVSSQAGVLLNKNYTHFKIKPNGAGITLG